MPDRLDVIVIGGGAIGCSAAYYLAREGCRVRVLEAREIGRGCSHGNCGYVCPSHALPLTAPGAIRRVIHDMFNRNSAFYVRPRFDPALWYWLARFAFRCHLRPMMEATRARNALLSSSMNLYREMLAEEQMSVEWEVRGLLFVYRNEREFAEHEAAADLARRDFGVVSTPYHGTNLTELEPTLRPNFAGGWHYPDDAHLRPDQLMSEMARVLQARGVDILEHTEVAHIDVSEGRAQWLETNRGRMSSDIVVLAAGAESPRLAKQLNCRLPIQPGKGYSITLPRPRHSPAIPIIFEESHVAVTPWQSGIRIGSTMEFVGYDRQPNQRRVELFMNVAKDNFIQPLTGPVQEEWNGWRPMVYDEVPCIGHVPRCSNAIVAAGHGMIGISTMTASGKLVSELALQQTPHLDPAPYSPNRFNS